MIDVVHDNSQTASPLLSTYAPTEAPWIQLHAGSNQIQPIFIGPGISG